MCLTRRRGVFVQTKRGTPGYQNVFTENLRVTDLLEANESECSVRA